jgi:hypothetical protein
LNSDDEQDGVECNHIVRDLTSEREVKVKNENNSASENGKF